MGEKRTPRVSCTITWGRRCATVLRAVFCRRFYIGGHGQRFYETTGCGRTGCLRSVPPEPQHYGGGHSPPRPPIRPKRSVRRPLCVRAGKRVRGVDGPVHVPVFCPSHVVPPPSASGHRGSPRTLISQPGTAHTGLSVLTCRQPFTRGGAPSPGRVPE